MIQPLQYHPIVRAALLRLARRIRFEGIRLRREIDTLEAAEVFANVMPASELIRLWRREREAAFEWCSYAAVVLEAGAGYTICDETGAT